MTWPTTPLITIFIDELNNRASQKIEIEVEVDPAVPVSHISLMTGLDPEIRM